MNDLELEDRLRTTFVARAGTITRGPGWDGAEQVRAAPQQQRNRTRWVAPLAAAAAVLTVVGVVLGLRDSGGSKGWISAAAQRPIPAGMKAVDALGVEIFVPSSWPVDNGPCWRDGVRRPTVYPTSWLGAKCAPALRDEPSVAFTAAPTTGIGKCLARITLGDEAGCVRITQRPEDLVEPAGYALVVSWPRHQVSLRTFTLTFPTGLRILQSAHAVPIDRNGCAARADANVLAGPAQRTDPSVPFDSELLPASTQQLSVCWYIAYRLVASALLDQDKAQRVLQVAAGMPAKWQGLGSHSGLPSCASMARTDGVLLISHRANHPDRVAVADFAACGGAGQRTSRSATADFLTSPELATAIQKASGIPLSLGYRATN